MLNVPQRPGQSGTLELGPRAGEPGAEPVVVPRVAEYPPAEDTSPPHPIPARGESSRLKTRKEKILSKTTLMDRKF